VTKDGRPLRILAPYDPALDVAGKPVEIVRFASDITACKALAAETRAGAGRPYRPGAGVFVATDDGRERASCRTVDLSTYC
jgi:hypothetical protein